MRVLKLAVAGFVAMAGALLAAPEPARAQSSLDMVRTDVQRVDPGTLSQFYYGRRRGYRGRYYGRPRYYGRRYFAPRRYYGGQRYYGRRVWRRFY